MAILPLNQGGTGSDLSGTGGADEFVKQTASGANLSVATITTADIAAVGIVKNPTAPQTITGQSLTFTKTAPLTLAQLENVQIVDSTLSRGGTDIGDEINKAYAALPATGGAIWIAPQSSGAPYSFTTPILFGTAGKYVKLLGLAPASQTGTAETGSMGGATLRFTPTTSSVNLTLTAVGTATAGGQATYTGTITGGAANALAGKTFQVSGFAGKNNNGYYVCTASTSATLVLSNGFATAETHAGTASQCVIAMTWANSGNAFAPTNSLENICLTNLTTGMVTCGHYGTSSGSAAVGLDFSGAGRLVTQNVRITGFGVGRQCISPAEWGAKDFNLVTAFNAVGTILHNGMENYSWIGGACIVNGVGFQLSGSIIVTPDCTFANVSFDGNGVADQTVSMVFVPGFGYGVVAHAGCNSVLTFTACHFENPFSTDTGPSTTHYVQTQQGSITINGGLAANDNAATVGNPTDWWFNASGSGAWTALNIYGLTLTSGSQINTTVFQANGAGGFLSGANATPGAVTNLVGGSGAASVTNAYTQGTVSTAVLSASTLVVAPLVSSPVYQSQSFVKLTNGTAVPLGANPSPAGLALLYDVDGGGTALVGYDQTGGIPVTIIWQTGTNTFQTGAPVGAQIQVGLNGTPQLTVKGTATNATQKVGYTQIINTNTP